MAVEAMKLGAHDFMAKPFNIDAIKALCALAANNGTPKQKTDGGDRYAIITQNTTMMSLIQEIKDVADSQASVFIQGESGTGKELFARLIHNHSHRSGNPFVAVNCAALPETLLESELFGHEKGAFTGAVSQKKGKFEAAHQGTLLLDEISEMDSKLQSKLLRVLQEREIDRVGGMRPVPIDVRVIATTNRDIDSFIEEGQFRQDLYYRLNVIPVTLPPLRERKDDIPLLAAYFVKKYNLLDKRNVKNLTIEALQTLAQMDWKGNVRELENVIERAVLRCKSDQISPADLFLPGISLQQPSAATDFSPTTTLKEMEKQIIFNALDHTNGNRTHAAEILGISVRTLRNKLNEYRKKMEAPLNT